MFKLRKEEGKIYVQSDYNPTFIAKIKKIGGRWSASTKEWYISADSMEALEKILDEVFGSRSDEPIELIRVEYSAEDFVREGDVYIGRLCMVDRPRRDSMVSYHYDTAVVDGEFPGRGGSMKYPMAKPSPGTVLRSSIPRGVYDKLEEELKQRIVIIEETDRRQCLISERDKLLSRIAEIDKELEAIE